tara:strand:+ start:573 stop:1496 length:924 start_codon:yes stop_codon:yes gene_type:complete
MRNAFVEEITKISKKNKKIVILVGDIGYKLYDDFKIAYPKRFYNCGVAEANMTTVAAGLALKGFKPITYTIATFNVYKTVEQIKVDVAYPNLPVIIVGVGAGLSYSGLGSTHHATEDIGVLRSIPNLNIVVPADPSELRSLLKEIIKSKKPTYLRIGKRGEKYIYKNIPNTKIGKANYLVRGKKICIIGCGNILVNAFYAIKKLNKKNIFPSLVSMHTIKPLDTKLLKKIFKSYTHIVVLEEHSEIGGLAGAVSEFYTDNNYKNNNFLKMNIGNKFVLKTGHQNHAFQKLNLNEKQIMNRIERFIKK